MLTYLVAKISFIFPRRPVVVMRTYRIDRLSRPSGVNAHRLMTCSIIRRGPGAHMACMANRMRPGAIHRSQPQPRPRFQPPLRFCVDRSINAGPLASARGQHCAPINLPTRSPFAAIALPEPRTRKERSSAGAVDARRQLGALGLARQGGLWAPTEADDEADQGRGVDRDGPRHRPQCVSGKWGGGESEGKPVALQRPPPGYSESLSRSSASNRKAPAGVDRPTPGLIN